MIALYFIIDTKKKWFACGDYLEIPPVVHMHDDSISDELGPVYKEGLTYFFFFHTMCLQGR